MRSNRPIGTAETPTLQPVISSTKFVFDVSIERHGFLWNNQSVETGREREKERERKGKELKGNEGIEGIAGIEGIEGRRCW